MTSLTTGLVLKVLFLSFNSYKATLTLLNIKYSTASEGLDGWVRTYMYAGKIWVPGKTKNIFTAFQAIVIIIVNGEFFM